MLRIAEPLARVVTDNSYTYTQVAYDPLPCYGMWYGIKQFQGQELLCAVLSVNRHLDALACTCRHDRARLCPAVSEAKRLQQARVPARLVSPKAHCPCWPSSCGSG
eukprot:1159656-Pelagomonas_calceolata.AAC.14